MLKLIIRHWPLALAVIIVLYFAVGAAVHLRRQKIHAVGPLTHIGTYSDIHELAKMFRQEEVVPVAPRTMIYGTDPPSELIGQVPSPPPGRIPPLEPSGRYRDLREKIDVVAGGPLAAALWAHEEDLKMPCVVVIRYRDARGVHRLQRQLGRDRQCELVIFDGGKGLLIISWGQVVVLRAPKWEPEVAMDSSDVSGGFRLFGQAVDGSEVWLLADNHDHPLWVFDALSGELSPALNERGPGGNSCQPSPDGALCAVNPVAMTRSLTRLPLRVVDRIHGTRNIVAWRADPFYGFYPVGWSATNPRSLYFITRHGRNLWRLDIPEELPVSSRE
ncbi:MAG: hypothetical protein KAW89_08340 [Armatimonadetes bacterium]|nr:hypothetical protein [Armatimonadota bacterium]